MTVESFPKNSEKVFFISIFRWNPKFEFEEPGKNYRIFELTVDFPWVLGEHLIFS